MPRVYYRTGPRSGVSFGFGTLLALLLVMAVLGFWGLLIFGAVAVIGGLVIAIRTPRSRRAQRRL